MMTLTELMAKQPIVPFIRESDFAPRKPWRYPERRLLDYLLVYIQEGKCRFSVNHEEYLFEAGQYCLVQPGSLLDLEGLTETITPYAHFDIFYHPERGRSFPTRPGQVDLTPYRDLIQPRLNDVYGLEIPVRLQPRNPLKFRENFIQLIELFQLHEPMMQLKAQHLATEIVISMFEDYYQTNPIVRVSSHSFNWITSYFSIHLNEPLSIQNMANRANLSASRFSALFKQRYGVSPHQYLLTMRINHAQELLETTELSQEEIASYCGFADIHHFSKTFKKHSGLTPGQWRNSLV